MPQPLVGYLSLLKLAPPKARAAETANLEADPSLTSVRLLPRRLLPVTLETFPPREVDALRELPRSCAESPCQVASPATLFPSLGAFNPPNPEGSSTRLCSRSSPRPRRPRDPLHQGTFTCDPAP